MNSTSMVLTKDGLQLSLVRTYCPIHCISLWYPVKTDPSPQVKTAPFPEVETASFPRSKQSRVAVGNKCNNILDSINRQGDAYKFLKFQTSALELIAKN